MAQIGLLITRVSHHWVNATCIPTRRKMRSEEATLRYLKRHMSIPVLDMSAYDTDIDGAVGGAWMIMELINGENASSIWESLSHKQKYKLSLAVGDQYQNMLSLRFNAIGSIDASKRCFFIGPMLLLQEETGDSHYRHHPHPIGLPTRATYVRSTDEISCSSDLAMDKTLITLDHPDFSIHNIIVRSDDPTVTTGIIDWEGAHIVPIWATNPTFMWPIFAPPEEQDHF
ncbi:uncharacterized protein BT62DRAFT_923163 [Guyanagaster necrorhizus]|uniref:Aminoglycoside phosphotransferase domain-containing protein n=1 Tax=Guyanagaster necrorhizus TaxID=856835 RepID=A0A9P7VJC9_9AGAR|nr:uncharacterized protein BT62DRAFT_923163 [Guyanagaster necrorhizus MCA 3950]KAG7441759.1 hypothetical protein BT62DRAFT_923163 [Guyanagaster necrorhizus MCA 3950]